MMRQKPRARAIAVTRPNPLPAEGIVTGLLISASLWAILLLWLH